MFYGWWVVAYAFLMAVWSWGLGFYGLSVFLVALQEQHGWSASAVSFGIAAYYLLGAFVMTGLGDLMRRLGLRRTVLGGVCAMAAGVVGLTWAAEVWQLYVAFAAMAVGWATTTSASINILLAPWFDRRRGIAVSLAMTGATCGGMVVAPLLLPAIGALGFRLGVGAAAAAMLAMLLPFAALVLGRTPASLGLGPDGAPLASGAVPSRPPVPAAGRRTARGEALRTRRYWTLSIAFAFALAAQVGLLTHFVAYVAPLHGTAVAAFTLSLSTFSALVSRFIGGGMADRFDRRIVSAAVFSIQAVGVFLLTRAASPWALYAGCILFGSGVGNVTTLPALLVHREFRPDQFAPVVSLVVATNQVTFAFAPSILGVLRDATDGYRAPLLLCLGLELAAAVIVLLGRGRKTGANAQTGETMLQLRPNCECCDRDLAPDSMDAVICSFECTFCRACADTVLRGRCPNCGGELVRRPIRPPAALARHPASTERVTRRAPCVPAA